MFKITIEATTEKDKELLPELFSTVCYGITDDMGIKLSKKTKWDGHSGGDDAFFGLLNKTVEVMIKE